MGLFPLLPRISLEFRIRGVARLTRNRPKQDCGVGLCCYENNPRKVVGLWKIHKINLTSTSPSQNPLQCWGIPTTKL